MTSTYIVKRNQNIYDVAVQIYGSVEGLFDLLISNEDLAMDSELKEGQELNYHKIYVRNQSMLDTLNSEHITLANGMAKEVASMFLKRVQFLMVANVELASYNMGIVGEGPGILDWGDNTLHEIELLEATSAYPHQYIQPGKVKIELSSANNITGLDIRGIEGIVYLQECHLSLESYSEDRDNITEDGILIFGDQIKRMTLQNKREFDVMCLDGFDLNYLNLIGTTFKEDSLFEYIKTRKEKSSWLEGGAIYLSESSITNPDVIRTIYDMTNDEDFGEKWIVFIDDTVFRKDGFDYFLNFPLS